MQRKRLTQIDTETGEQIDGYIAVIQPKRRNGFDRWCSMSQDAMIWFCRETVGDLE